jgi:hypothetical protein
VVFASFFNSDDSQSQNTFHVKIISGPSVPNNQYYLQVFENDERIVDFLIDSNDSSEIFDDQTDVPISKYYVSLESLFTTNDKKKIQDPKEEVSIRKVQETQKINIGIHDSPKYINIGTGCTMEEIDQYTSLFK